MSRYVRSIKVEFEHGGDHIKAELKPLKFVDLLALQTKAPDGEPAMLAEFLSMLPRYLVSMEGAVDSEGQTVTIEDLGDAYWAEAVARIMVDLVNATQPKDPT